VVQYAKRYFLNFNLQFVLGTVIRLLLVKRFLDDLAAQCSCHKTTQEDKDTTNSERQEIDRHLSLS